MHVSLKVARALIDRLGELVTIDACALPVEPATVLHAIYRRQPDGRAEEIDEPYLEQLDTLMPGRSEPFTSRLTMGRCLIARTTERRSDDAGGTGVSAGHEVAVDLQGGGGVTVAEAGGHGGDRLAGV